jgi:hypothetical protein
MSLSMPVEQVKRAGGWVSDAVWDAYIEPTLQDRVAGSKVISRYAIQVDKPEWFPQTLDLVSNECLTDEEDYDA